MTSRGKVQVVVKSRTVPTGTVSFSQPVFSMSGIRIGEQRDLRVVYGSVLDQEHERAIEEGRKLAHRLGLELEVVDESKAGILKRIATSLTRSLAQRPTLVVSPSPRASKASPSNTPAMLDGPVRASSPPQAACAFALTPKLFTSV
jgi:hypothetical protein